MSYYDLEIGMIPVEKVFASQHTEDDDGQFVLTITDNGSGGDGCDISIKRNNSHGEMPISFTVPTTSLTTLREAIDAVIRLRSAQ